MNKPLALIVDDDDSLVMLYEHVLTPIGFETVSVQNGNDALAQLDVIVPDLVVLDLDLSDDVTGVDILRQIRADKRLAATRVMVVSGSAHIAATIRDEADLVLLKPFSTSQLKLLATRLLNPNGMREKDVDESSALTDKQTL